jgi:hypothetical protein
MNCKRYSFIGTVFKRMRPPPKSYKDYNAKWVHLNVISDLRDFDDT